MAVTETSRQGGDGNRLKAAAPAAAAVGIISAIVGVSLLAGSPGTSSAPDAADTPAVTAEPSGGASAPAPAAIPGLAQPQFDQPGGAGAVQTSMEIVVKFKDDSRIKDILDGFWRDEKAAKARFDTWKANRPEFAGLKLDRVTYSNELVLVHDGSVPPAQRLAAMRAIAGKLGAAADISYAEPNMTAHPGGQ